MRPPEGIRVLTRGAWQAEGERRFGPDMRAWQFVCPNCGHVAAVADFMPFRHLGADENAATCACIGLYAGVKDGAPRPCRYSAWGPGPRLCAVRILIDDRVTVPCFAFAEPR